MHSLVFQYKMLQYQLLFLLLTLLTFSRSTWSTAKLYVQMHGNVFTYSLYFFIMTNQPDTYHFSYSDEFQNSLTALSAVDLKPWRVLLRALFTLGLHHYTGIKFILIALFRKELEKIVLNLPFWSKRFSVQKQTRHWKLICCIGFVLNKMLSLPKNHSSPADICHYFVTNNNVEFTGAQSVTEQRELFLSWNLCLHVVFLKQATSICAGNSKNSF